MTFRYQCTMYLFLAIFLMPGHLVWGGQVATQETREWAKKVLQEEKALKTVTVPNTVAVLYFFNKTGREELDPLQKGLPLMLITDLSSVKGLQVVERIKLQALVEEIGLGASGLVEPNTAPRVGKLLRAQWLTGGDITEAQQSQLQVQSKLLDVPTSKIVGQPGSEGRLTELFRIEKDLLFKIIKLLKIEVSPAEEARLMKPCSTNTSALFALFEGVDASDHQEYEKAAKLYEKALQEDPNICLANDSLAELQGLGLVPATNRTGDLLQSLQGDTSLSNTIMPKDEIKDVKTPKDVSPDINIRLNFPQ